MAYGVLGDSCSPQGDPGHTPYNHREMAHSGACLTFPPHWRKGPSITVMDERASLGHAGSGITARLLKFYPPPSFLPNPQHHLSPSCLGSTWMETSL